MKIFWVNFFRVNFFSGENFLGENFFDPCPLKEGGGVRGVSFQKMYGFGGVGEVEVEIWSDVTIAGRTNEQ